MAFKPIPVKVSRAVLFQNDDDDSDDSMTPKKALYIDLPDVDDDLLTEIDFSRPPSTLEEHIRRVRLEEKEIEEIRRRRQVLQAMQKESSVEIDAHQSTSRASHRSLDPESYDIPLPLEVIIQLKEHFELYRRRAIDAHEKMEKFIQDNRVSRQAPSEKEDQTPLDTLRLNIVRKHKIRLALNGERCTVLGDEFLLFLGQHEARYSLLSYLTDLEHNQFLWRLCDHVLVNGPDMLNSCVGFWLMSTIISARAPLQERSMCTVRQMAKMAKTWAWEIAQKADDLVGNEKEELLVKAKLISRFVVLVALVPPFVQRDILQCAN